ncbi:HotDog domain-containing protein [Chytridium lagenaria]|nr:HotDog domain-containing protein [Chytridium lagenaria]
MNRINQFRQHLHPSRALFSTTSASKTSTPDSALSFTSPSLYKFWIPIQTRWNDNDQYGHVNNSVFYSYFDTVVNVYLSRHCGHDPATSSIRGLVISSTCRYYNPISYPSIVHAGMAVEKLGNSSVTYRLGVFVDSENKVFSEKSKTLVCAASGSFVHVFVNSPTREGLKDEGRPTPMPEAFRENFAKLLIKT